MQQPTECLLDERPRASVHTITVCDNELVEIPGKQLCERLARTCSIDKRQPDLERNSAWRCRDAFEASEYIP